MAETNAAQLESAFKEYSVAEFFKKNRQMLGYAGEVRSLTTIVHEYVTNSLDSAEEAKILPEILIQIDSLAAAGRHTELGAGDGSKQTFEIDDEIARAASLQITVNGLPKERGVDYVIKYEKKGKQSMRVLQFKSETPAPAAKIDAKWAAGHLKVIAEDNGTGIPKSKIGLALGQLLAGTKFASRAQRRGQQGIGAAYATLFSQITTGKPIHVKTGLGDGKIFECDLRIDVQKNAPVMSNQNEHSGKFKGLRVEAEFAEVSFDKSEYGVYEYLRRTALANPHAQLTLIDPNKEITVFPRASNVIPVKAKEVKPHPLGLSTSDVVDMAKATTARKISSFLQGDFEKISGDKVNELKALCGNIDFEKHPSKLQWFEAEAIVHAFRKVKFFNPDLDSVVPIGEEQITKSLKSLLAPEVLAVCERKPRVFRGGIPFLVEAAIAYGGKAGQKASGGAVSGEFMRFANRTPLLFDAGSCATTEAVKSIEWNRYDLKDWENMPVSIFINFVSVYVPYTGAGKLAISPEEETIAEIRFALMECARQVAVYIHGLQKAEDAEARKQIFFKYISEVAQALNEITGKPKAELEEKLRKIAVEKTAILEAQVENGEKELEELEEAAEKEIEEDR
ncbi:TPA: DNA topoisomerase VI subunit B [Candidatus Micrarchaeota archaeon]|nr:DNA topoisomerase VI subunit B [Candidatus Micrarchaeota archaeon]